MFENEAEERTKQYMNEHTENYNCENTRLETDNYNAGLEQGYEDGFQDGAEFGYNKASEWHYVKDGDLPKGNGLFVIYWKLGDIDNYIIFRGTIGNLHKDAIAWKEIIPPNIKEE